MEDYVSATSLQFGALLPVVTDDLGARPRKQLPRPSLQVQKRLRRQAHGESRPYRAHTIRALILPLPYSANTKLFSIPGKPMPPRALPNVDWMAAAGPTQFPAVACHAVRSNSSYRASRTNKPKEVLQELHIEGSDHYHQPHLCWLMGLIQMVCQHQNTGTANSFCPDLLAQVHPLL